MRSRTRLLVAGLGAALAVLAALVPGAVVRTSAPLAKGAETRPVLIRLIERAPVATKDAVVATQDAAVAPAPVAPEEVVRTEPASAPARADTAAAGVPDVEDVGATHPVVFAEHAADRGPSAASSSGRCPKPTTCDVHVLMPARWKTDSTGKLVLKWKYNDEGRRKLRAPAGLLESALKSGMAEWERWNSNVDFAYFGTTAALFGAKGSNGSCDDGTNVIGWSRLEPGVIAEVMTCVDKTGRRVVDADLALNVTFHWEDIQDEPESRHSYDIRSIVTHELGHYAAALGDLYSGDAMYQTMMGNEKYGEVRKRTLALGDIVGLQRAYPCGEGDTCPRKGIVND